MINRLMCVGVSSYRPSRADGAREANEVALDELSAAVSLKINSEVFATKVRPLFADSRRALLDAYSAAALDPKSAEANGTYQRLADARHRAAEALAASVGTAPARSDWFWEEYAGENGAGNEVLVFVRFDISMDALKALVERYTTEKDVGGGRAVTAFPLLAYAFDDFVGGAQVTDARGKLVSKGSTSGVITRVGTAKVSNVVELEAALEAGGELGFATLPMPPTSPGGRRHP